MPNDCSRTPRGQPTLPKNNLIDPGLKVPDNAKQAEPEMETFNGLSANTSQRQARDIRKSAEELETLSPIGVIGRNHQKVVGTCVDTKRQ